MSKDINNQMDFIEKTSFKAKMSVMVLIVALAFLALVFTDSLKKEERDSLRMVSILFRHGEKTPTNFYPNDPHSKIWPNSLGTLTQKGILQAFDLGQNLRLRYHKLLPENGIYSQQNMLILCSAAERCVMSAQSMLAGFAPPFVENSPLPIAWQPIPVKTISREEDTILAQKKSCFKYDSILRSMYETPPPDLQQLNEQNTGLFEFLSNQTGKNVSNVLDVEILYNTLKSEYEMGLNLPDWTKSIYPNILKPLAERSYVLFTKTDFMKKVKGGAFLREVVSNMKGKNNVKTINRKIYFYSGHDVTIVNVLNSLDIMNQTDSLPQFCSALAFELHENPFIEDNSEVKIYYYQNSSIIDPINIVIPNCQAPCSLTQFVESINNLLFDDYDKLCENPIKDCNS